MFNNKIEVENRIYDLNYDVSQACDGSFELSVSKLYCGNIVDKSVVRLMPISFNDVADMANMMCRNTVTPVNFHEIVEEMVLSRIIVE